MWESENENRNGGFGRDRHGNHDSLKTDGFERRGQSWYVSSEIASDVLVRVGDANFHLHKGPLLARSGKMNRVMYESSSSRDTDSSIVELDGLPGGPESFELAAKFCYGVEVDLTASNISGLRCAAEYLEMTEDLEEGNLIFKTEAFLSYVVLSSWRDSIVVLKSCESLSPWAENLQIVRRCSESIAWKACASPRSIWWAYTGRTDSPRPGRGGSKGTSPGQSQAPPDWWFEDASVLRVDHFVRVVTAIRAKGTRLDLIGAAIVHYASKWLQEDLAKEESTSTQIKEQRMVIESLISIIPLQKDCVSCSFLLRLLKQASMLKVAPALVAELEKRVGTQLEQASVSDLLVPTHSKSDTMYDVDLMQRLVEHFLAQEQTRSSSPGRDTRGEKARGHETPRARTDDGRADAKMRVARLLDCYLTEVSRDRNLSPTKFQLLAESLPESTRSCDDGLYRAVDSYLKAHPRLTEHERKELCRVVDCRKLSADACTHASQNERLPLRVVVQVLFSEQVKISNAFANSSLQEEAGDVRRRQPVASSTGKQLLEETPQSFQEGWAAAKKDIDTLKFELESAKAKYLELQNDMDALQTEFDKMTPSKPIKSSSSSSSAWSSGWKKLSKMAKIGETSGMGEQVHVGKGEQVRKGPRRWRNSIS
ncbi:root phototropism protein 3-like [Iris pallida]|uniref:Root phototropism protein 3-like n=1 Tax=Iris pallida TaxID=29817 RepID=A0AAX6DJ99_IRIPA|nr:root phototropism protein 3-like [Iris pallida]